VFEERTLPGPSRVLSDVLLHDFDGDQNVDVALAHAGGVSLWWGDGTGWPGEASEVAPDAARSLAMIDADGEAGKELGVLGAGQVVLFAFEGRQLTEQTRLLVEPEALKVRVADVDRDGVDDLVVSHPDGFRVLLGVPHRP
jgi:hypothetical protein